MRELLHCAFADGEGAGEGDGDGDRVVLGVGVGVGQGAGQAASSKVRVMGLKNEYGTPNMGMLLLESGMDDPAIERTFVLV